METYCVVGYKGTSDSYIDANIQLAITAGKEVSQMKVDHGVCGSFLDHAWHDADLHLLAVSS